jgi:predicted Zn-dependent peptidase
MGMLDEGAGEYDAIALGNRQEQLGAAISASASLDSAEVTLSALKENLAPSLALWSDVILRPRFEPTEIDRVRANWLASIQQEKTQPGAMAMRVIGPVMYGANHPYAIPFTGSGYEADIATLDRNDLLAWHQEQIRPDTATVMVVGDTTLAEMLPLLEQQFGSWKAPAGAHPTSAIPAVALPAKPRVFLVDQPGAVQANIIAAQLLPSSTDAGTVDMEFANSVFGGDFTSRLNMNLREDKHWSYGARSSAVNSLGQRLWTASAPVQIDKTIESIKEMQKEIGDFASGRRAVDDEEVARLQAIAIRTLPGSYETARNVLSTIGSINRYGRPDDFVTWRKGKIEKMTAAGVQQVATADFKPESLTWIIIGDRSKIEAGVRALNLGEVTVLDADGKVVK